MSIKIQSIKANKIFNIDDEAKLHYHLLDPLNQMRLLKKNMRNGKIDESLIFDMAYDFMELMITNWEGIINDDTDEPIKFKKELVKILPLDVAMAFVVKVITPSFKGLIDAAGKVKESTAGN